MAIIKNPADIVEKLVGDYRAALGDNLLSVVMYGSAVTHEYRPGISDINIAVVVNDDSILALQSTLPLQRRWGRRGVAIPFFMTPAFIAGSCDSYPVEFLNIRLSYRVLTGDDIFKTIEIRADHLRLQCERECKGAALHVRREYLRCGGSTDLLMRLLSDSLRTLMPVLRALAHMAGGDVPHSRADVVARVEDRYVLGSTAISDCVNMSPRAVRALVRKDPTALFNRFAADVDKLILKIDALSVPQGV